MNCTGPLTSFFSNKYCKCIFLMILITFSLASFIVRTKYEILNIQKLCLSIMSSIALPVSSTLLVVKSLGSQKLHKGFQLHGVLVPLTPAFLKGQLYTEQAQMVQINKSHESTFKSSCILHTQNPALRSPTIP